MPYGYLEGNQQDQAALNRMGSTFSDAVIGMQRQRIQAQQFQQELAQRAAQMAQQRDLALRELDQRNTEIASMSKLRTAQVAKAEDDVQQSRDQRQAGGELADVMKGLYETDPTKNPDITQFLRGIQAQQTARIAATNPSNIATQTAQIAQGRDPRVERMMATGTPATATLQPGAALVDTMSGKPLFQNDPRVALRDPRQLQQEEIRSLLEAYGALNKDMVPNNDPVVRAVRNKALTGMGIQRGDPHDAGQGAVLPPGRVPIFKNGQPVGHIPQEQVQDAIAQGYEVQQ